MRPNPLRRTLGSNMSISSPRVFWFSFASFSVYFGAFLAQKIFPSFDGTAFAFFWTLSLLVSVPLLVLFALWAAIALAGAHFGNKPLGAWPRVIGYIALSGIAASTISIVISNLLPATLPSGSYERPFDRGTWADPASANYVEGDITPRQKMLADVVSKLPGKNRSTLEAMLGSSLETGYFKDSGRDLIYVTGPQRDSFFAIDSEWLLIWLDERGNYKRHAIFTD